MESPRLTLFASPKPLDGGHFELIQRNAVASWQRLPGRPEIVLFGDESTARLAADLGVRYSEVALTESGAPRLDDLFPRAEELAGGDVLAYVNADIVLMSDFARAVERVVRARRRFLVVGRRTDLDVRESLDFSDGWEPRLRERAVRDGVLQWQRAIDYFVFPRGLWGEIPPLAAGRASFDNWLLGRALQLGAPLVDATPVVLAVHQNHDYSHVAGGRASVYSGAEADRNMELAGGYANLTYVHDATHFLSRRLLLPAVAPRYLRQRWTRYSASSEAVRLTRHVALGVRLKLGRLLRLT
jgi:hypothetical protein